MEIEVLLETPVGVLNYALELEHLVFAFYRDGLDQFTAAAFAAAGYAPNVFDYFATIRDQELEHVTAISQIIRDLGGVPVTEARYDFGVADLAGFLETARTLENLSVSAYEGAVRNLLGENELVTAILAIHGVEARHAAYLNGLTGESPFPEPFDPPLTPSEALDFAGSFIVEE